MQTSDRNPEFHQSGRDCLDVGEASWRAIGEQDGAAHHETETNSPQGVGRKSVAETKSGYRNKNNCRPSEPSHRPGQVRGGDHDHTGHNGDSDDGKGPVGVAWSGQLRERSRHGVADQPGDEKGEGNRRNGGNRHVAQQAATSPGNRAGEQRDHQDEAQEVPDPPHVLEPIGQRLQEIEHPLIGRRRIAIRDRCREQQDQANDDRDGVSGAPSPRLLSRPDEVPRHIHTGALSRLSSGARWSTPDRSCQRPIRLLSPPTRLRSHANRRTYPWRHRPRA